MPSRADDSLSRLRAGVACLDSAGRVAHWSVHMEDGDVAVGGIEDGCAVGDSVSGRIPPVEREPLPGLAADLGHPHPDGCRARVAIPRLDLVGEHFSRIGREAEILTVRLRRGEIEKLVVKADDNGHVVEDRVGGEVRPLGICQEPDVAGMPPTGDRLGHRVGRRLISRDRR